MDRFKLFTNSSEPKSIDIDKRQVRVVMSDESVDSDGEVTVQKGIDFKRFKKNPIVLKNHDMGSPFTGTPPGDPIGKVIEIDKFDDRTEAVVQFATADANPEGEKMLHLVAEGIVKTVSVGMQVLEQKEKKLEEALGGAIINYLTKTRLIELSFVNVPANENATIKSYKKDDEPATICHNKGMDKPEDKAPATETIESLKIAQLEEKVAAQDATIKTLLSQLTTKQDDDDAAEEEAQTENKQDKEGVQLDEGGNPVVAEDSEEAQKLYDVHFELAKAEAEGVK